MPAKDPEARIFWQFLRLEATAARLEGLLLADPELGIMWRRQIALTEACRSVALEGINVFEGVAGGHSVPADV